MAAWATGISLGPYVLLAPSGAGGMGEVWKARDTRLNRIVAVKRLKSRHTARFEQEARAIAAMNHPHICQIHDIGPDYLVLEYIDGQPLKGPLAAEEAMRLATQIAEALDAAHRKRVVHRDLKPANIMVTSEGSVKLLDFGLAKQVTDSDETATIEGTVLGTAAYMSPEQAEGKPADARSDVFSFGAVLYELLSGRRAFRGENAASTMAAILYKEPAPLEAPAGLQEIVKRCLAKPPEQRFQTIAEVKTALEELRQGATQPRAQPSIAVLPFSNMSADPDTEYFSDGLAEEIINALAHIPGLKVIARTSAFAFKGKHEDIRKIAATLGVATILEGSVRRSGARLRVTAQLIQATDGSHLWSERYDREMAEVFAMQDEIAQAIASALQVKLSGAPAAAQQYKPSLPAYEALLKARHYLGSWRPDTFPRIKECFEQAIALDPKFALAHCEYGNYFYTLARFGALPANQALPMMRSQVQKALELDPTLPEAHAMLGVVAAILEFDWKEAERRFRLAMAHDPVPPLVRLYYALSYPLAGRTKPLASWSADCKKIR
jgi:TolB-like protein/tRNA A-37 threonylcarbamoyl transferase component Bud32